ncbi:MAG: GNAT family N-acetyltransferase [Phycisphaerales bacterium]
MIRVRRITKSDPLYPQAVDLRERVLLAPLGYTLERFLREYPGFEDRLEHFVALVKHPQGERVVGTVCLRPEGPIGKETAGRLTQMCVDPQRQGEGVGQMLLSALERRAFGELGLPELYCHAQDRAIGFYERLGWTTDGPMFTEAGIPHRKMRFRPEDRPDLIGTEQIADEEMNAGPAVDTADQPL